MNTVIQTAFNDARKFIQLGIYCFITYFSCCYTIWNGIVPLLSNAFGNANQPIINDTTGDSNATVSYNYYVNGTSSTYLNKNATTSTSV